MNFQAIKNAASAVGHFAQGSFNTVSQYTLCGRIVCELTNLSKVNAFFNAKHPNVKTALKIAALIADIAGTAFGVMYFGLPVLAIEGAVASSSIGIKVATFIKQKWADRHPGSAAAAGATPLITPTLLKTE
jgi:hypothetical protein